MRSLVAMTIAVLTLSGCAQISAQFENAQDPEPVTRNQEAGPILVTRQWGVVDGMLSVVVSNTTSRTMRYADAVLTARDAQNVLIASTSTAARDPGCCDVMDLPPGAEFGFYFDVGEAGRRIERVDVVYRNVQWEPFQRDRTSTATATPVRLRANPLGAVVVADVTVKGRLLPQARAQAFLSDREGDFLAVVSGRWNCFDAGKRRIRMQLFHPVPPGTQVDSVMIYPITHDQDWPQPTCQRSGS
ncbi:hypothetical protein [Nocardioides sp.]|uniref:hypothetical protein n=1 Tax=Nocardioides sp. TaxID=35761 RepID=UPI00356A712D